MTANPVHNSIDYTEITVTDLGAAKEFYGSVFAWKFTDYGDAYVGFTCPGRISESGGFLLNEEPRPAGGPFVLLYTDDLDATAAAISVAGGQVTQGPYDFPGGRRLHFADPSGNELGAWSVPSL